MDDDQLSALLEQAAAWRDDDPDPRSRAELEALVAAAEGEGGGADGSLERARADLADRFAGTLQFGTAGLRGAMGAGPNRMNRAVVIRAAAGSRGLAARARPGHRARRRRLRRAARLRRLRP